MGYALNAKSVEWNPSPERLRELAARMPNAYRTEFGSIDVLTRVHARSKGSTYIVTDDPASVTDQTVERAELDRMAQLQDDYIRAQDMLVIDGYIGDDPAFRTRARLVIEAANANIAGMQQQLYFPGEWAHGEQPDSEPVTTVVYTPNLPVAGYPDERAILVDLESNVTRVLNSDYFGESKKGGLRMWNNIVYERGGLALHAGCKVVPVDGDLKTVVIVGLSGTGKTTTTFREVLGSKPVQDDFVALMPGGVVHGSEAGCFAKTFGLSADTEPEIYHATVQPDAYLENVHVDGETGKVDFDDPEPTPNGRTTWPFTYVDPLPPREAPPASYLLILNRNQNIVPGVARLDRVQAAAYFMLGETTGTSAGGAAEAGKSLRVPGTNPFFPRAHADMGNRMLELLDSTDLQVFLLNTGWVGGGKDDEGSKKMTIADSAAIVEGIVTGTIAWEADADFGYDVAVSCPGISDHEKLQPRRLYERTNRLGDYEQWVERFKRERKDYLASYPGLHEEIVKSVL